MKHEPTLFLVDDDRAVRDALSLYLGSKGVRVTSYSSAHEFLQAYDPDRPGCLLLDIRMPGMDGLELQDALATSGVRIPIIFITGHGDVSMAVRAIKKGASDFLEKPFDNEALLACIKKAMAQDIGERQRERGEADVLIRFQQLTPRERDVMALVADGHPNKSIAKKLEISHRTVEIHRRRVMGKMAAESLSDLITMAVACGVHDIKLGRDPRQPLRVSGLST